MDLLDELNVPMSTTTHSPVEKPKPTNNGGGKKINMYDVDTIRSKPIDTDNFEKEGHSFMVHVFAGDDDVTTISEQLVKIAEKLKEKGFVYRCDAGDRDPIPNKIAKIEGLKKEVYLPFKKYNEDLADGATLTNTYELPYRYAAHIYGEKFNDLKKGARAIFAAKLMAALGENSDNPVDFILCYSPDGREYFGGKEKVDYSKLGTLSYYIRIGQQAGIPIYNIKNKESLINFANTYLKANED